ncbi:MAG: LytTR family DNA-binding domain-containing protein [Cryomorphaceae bacterium]|nr:LytTR family transcriptional regulator DNA-binding domain-containing protein [Flavobacteriales bacterium]
MTKRIELKPLLKPFPIETERSHVVRKSLVFGLFVFLFLLIFQPFGLSEIESGIWLYCLGYGAITTLCMLVFRFLGEVVFPSYFQEQTWTVGREIIATMINIFLIAGGNLLFSVWMGFFALTPALFILFLFFTLAIAIFPVALGAALKQSSLDRAHRRGSAEINENIEGRAVHREVGQIRLSDDDGNQSLSVDTDGLIFLESADNYVKAYFRKGDEVKSVIFRGALSRMEEELPTPPFLRCHRSYIVNVSAVGKVSGNARGYELSFPHTHKRIPVARRRIEVFNQQVNR